MPSIQHVIKNGGKLILMSHLGGPMCIGPLGGPEVHDQAGRRSPGELLGKPVKSSPGRGRAGGRQGGGRPRKRATC